MVKCTEYPPFGYVVARKRACRVLAPRSDVVWVSRKLAAAEGAAVTILLDTGAAVATAGTCFAAEVTVGNTEDSAAAGCEVGTIYVGLRSTCSTMLSPTL